MDDRRPRICMVGSSNTDLVARVSRLPRQGECLTGSSFEIGFGGKGANQAVMAARLGADVTVVTRLGRDVFGDSYVRHFQADGVDTRHVAFDEARPSGAALILVEEPTGLNTIAFMPGANLGLSSADVRAAADAIAVADVLLCQLETPIETTLEAFRMARSGGPRQPMTVLNTAPVPVPPRPLPDELLGLADLLIANEEEAAYLAGRPVDTLDQATETARDLARRWSSTVIITLGGRGVVLAEGDADVRHVPVRAVQAVDTTGAGDSFVGSLAYLLAGGISRWLAVERAAAIATLSVMRAGTQPSFPTRAEVRDQLGW
jgi:ribokinase